MVKQTSRSLDLTFSALSDPTRREILGRLTQQDLMVTEIAEPFEMSLPAVSKHLRVLERAGLIARSREGRVHRLRFDPKPLGEAMTWIAEHKLYWEEQFDLLERYLKKTTHEEETDGT